MGRMAAKTMSFLCPVQQYLAHDNQWGLLCSKCIDYTKGKKGLLENSSIKVDIIYHLCSVLLASQLKLGRKLREGLKKH